MNGGSGGGSGGGFGGFGSGGGGGFSDLHSGSGFDGGGGFSDLYSGSGGGGGGGFEFFEELSQKELENKKKVNILRKILSIAVREVNKNKHRSFKKFRLKFLKDLPPDSVLGTSDCFGYKPDPSRKMLIGTIIIKDTSNAVKSLVYLF